MALIAACITLLIYLPALDSEFINYDDSGYVYNNPAIRILDWDFIKWAFTTSYMGWLMPLTWLSFAIDYQIWGLDPFGYHLTNIVFHAVNTGMVVLLADRFYRDKLSVIENAGCSYLYPATLFFAGFLWGVHPLNVESVSWVTERKNVLNGIFFFGTILCYLRYTELIKLTGEKGRAISSYLLSLLLLSLGLLVKPIGVVTPVILLLIDWYPLRRMSKGEIFSLLAEKIPFCVLCALSMFATLVMARGEGFLVPYDLFTFWDRVIASGSTLFDYCLLMLFPIGINVMYLVPYPLPDIFIAKTVLVILFTGYCLLSVKKHPALFVIWCCYLLLVSPTLPFFLGGVHILCAHFVYLPLVAPSIAFAYWGTSVYQKTLLSKKRYLPLILIGIMIFITGFYVYMTQRLIFSWQTPETLWSRVIELRPAGRAYYYRADYYLKIGRYQAAADDLLVSIQMGKSAGYPGVFNLHALRGDALNKIGNYAEAVKDFTAAIHLNPHPTYYYHRGRALEALGRFREAGDDFMAAGGATGPIESRTWE